jgi:hypothetical protein
MLRKLDTSEHEGNGGNYEDAGCQHQDFGKIKARKYWDFRHGYFLRVPDTHDRKPPERGGIVLTEPRHWSAAAESLASLLVLRRRSPTPKDSFVTSNCLRHDRLLGHQMAGASVQSQPAGAAVEFRHARAAQESLLTFSKHR